MMILWLSAALMTLTALTHSFFGERRLIGPLLAIDHPLTTKPLARQVLRFAWHLTSLLMLMTAIMTVWPHTPVILIVINGGLWLFIGLFDGLITRGRHIGWPLLSAAGVTAMLGALL